MRALVCKVMDVCPCCNDIEKEGYSIVFQALRNIYTHINVNYM